ncbi:MAG: hypothetical protein ACJ8FS_14605 [Sphingomicrobium sp.]
MEVGPNANLFAYVAMFGWPAVCLVLFIALPIEIAAIASMLGGYLLLPSSLHVTVPFFPPLDKMMIASISTFLLCWMKGTQAKTHRPPILIYVFAAGFVLSPVFTSFGNSYELPTAAGSIPGFYPIDGLKIAFRQAVTLLPMFVGVRFLSNDHGRLLLLKSLPIAFLFYSLPMLFEIRMSPQLHTWVYGYFPHQFAQMMRAGGFRPVVFLSHGLELAILTSLALLAAIVLARQKARILYIPAAAVAGYLAVLLVLCKTLGAAIYAVVLTPVILFTRPRTWGRIACGFILIVAFYPTLRGSGLVPVEHIAAAANAISNDRADSFQVRLNNEYQLLAKANQKPLFGWGTWGRNRVYDRDTGKDLSITDGQWIIQFGMYGWFGYLSLFGLLAMAAFSSLRGLGNDVTRASLTLGGLTLLLAVYVVNMVPNSSEMSLTVLLAGSVAASARVRVRRPAAVRTKTGSAAPVPSTS